MDHVNRWVLTVALALGCGARGGYAEPGPLSPNAWPPPASSVSSGSTLQASPPQGRGSEIPPTVGPTGNAITVRPEDAPPPPECTTDLDCVPASCCHARACTTRARAPRCTEVRCTEVCEAGTMDCGQAACGCVRGLCVGRERGGGVLQGKMSRSR